MKKVTAIAVLPAILISLVLFTACGSEDAEDASVADDDTSAVEDVSIVVDNDFFRLEVPGGWIAGEPLPGVINIFYSNAESGDARANLMNFKDSVSVVLDSKTTLGEDHIAGIKEVLLSVLPGSTHSNDKCFDVDGHDTCSFEIDMFQNEINLKMVVVAIEGAGSDVWLVTYTTTAPDYEGALVILDEILGNFELN